MLHIFDVFMSSTELVIFKVSYKLIMLHIYICFMLYFVLKN